MSPTSKASTPAPLRPLPHVRPAVTWRSTVLGLIGVVIICGLTPYNDYALGNTFLVGNNLPIGVVMMSFLFVLAVNAPLHRWVPRQALNSGELAVALSMTLVGCALPSSGLMRYFPPSLVSPFFESVGNPTFFNLVEKMDLPRWIYPEFAGAGPKQWSSDPIVRDYISRWTEPGPYPYAAWIRPAVVWGIFLFAMYGSLMCMLAIVRRQWFENERLPFPLAQIHLALIEQPAPGRAFNAVLRKRPFWIGFAGIFLLHVWNGLSQYFPKYVPEIPVYYNVLYGTMRNPPWSYVTNDVKGAAVFFTAVGVTYFLSNSIAFSLWFFFIAMQVWRMVVGSYTGDPGQYGTNGGMDQHIGGVVAFLGSFMWVGRKHWGLVMAQAFRGPRPGEDRGRYMSYPVAFWGMVGCTGVMIAWLWFAGCSLVGAVVMSVLLLGLFMVITRIIAESGLMHGQLLVPINYPWTLAATYGFPLISSVKTFFFASMLQSVHFDFREVMPVYASHGMRVIDQTAFGGRDSADDGKEIRRSGAKVIRMLMFALLVGYIVSFGSTLWMEYKYSFTLNTPARQPNEWGVMDVPRVQLVEATEKYSKGNYYPQHRPAANLLFGFLFVTALSVLRLRFAWWPLHPIGFLMLYTNPVSKLWLSILIGWLAKNLILRFGGTRLYTAAKPFFLGLIVGESAAAGLWLVVGIARSSLGLSYHAVNILPG